MRDIAKFIYGFKRFQNSYFCGDAEVFERLRSGQNPRALVIGCSDSRVDPAIVMDCSPGDLFVVRNVANLVPPHESDSSHHGVSAALEYAVRVLLVEHVIVMGHSGCGGIHALMRQDFAQAGDYLPRWIAIGRRAREQVLAELPDKAPHLQERACEQAAILVSLENLLTFPWVRERVEAGNLLLHGWYFDLERGELLSYLPQSGQFEPLVPHCGRD
jgi:carbonic anhydrase